MTEQIYEHHLKIKNDKFCPFKLGFSGKPFGEVVSNWHKNIEVLLFTEGTAFIQYGTEDLSVKKDDIVVVNSGVLHRPHSNIDASYAFLIIDESFCIENSIDIENCVFEKKFNDEKTKAHFIKVKKEIESYSKKEEFSGLKLRCAVMNLLINLCSDHLVSANTLNEHQDTSEKYVKTTIEYLNEHFDEEINLDMLASLCSITKFHLSREFKRHTGQTIFTYIITLKCKKAQVYLSQGMTVTETALACGFDSVSYFSQTYKKVMGVSPNNAKKESYK